MGYDLALTNAVFDTATPMFGTASLKGGYGIAPAGAVAPNTPLTLGCSVKIAAAPSGTKVACGNSTKFGWLGIDSSGKAQAFVGSGSGYINFAGPVISDGVKHRLAFSTDGTFANTHFFVDGVSIAKSGTSGSAVVLVAGPLGVNSDYDGSLGWPGSIDEIEVRNTNYYTAAYTPSTSAMTGSEAGVVSYYNCDGNGTDTGAGASTPASTALAIGALSLTQTDAGGISVGVASALSAGSGSGYSYKVYRGTDPNFTPAAGSLLATVASLPYVDTTVAAGTQYFYGVIGSDSAGTTVNAIPAGLAGAPTTSLLYASATPPTTAIALVCAGDSITYGAGVTNAGSVSSPTMPFFLLAKLKRLLGTRNIYGANKGVSGYTTTDWAPSGSTYGAAKTAMTNLLSADPNAQPVLSLMLGTNDSASAGTNNGGVSGGLTAAQFQANLKTIVDQWLVDFPTSKVFVHMSPWYSPNFQNTCTYLQAGLSRLVSYRAAITALVAVYAKPSQVFVGDTYAFDYFAKNGPLGEQQAENGNSGTFFCHPAGTAGANGFIGTQSLGEMHAQAIAQGLYGVVASSTSAPRFVNTLH